jgi:hypothetical protein
MKNNKNDNQFEELFQILQNRKILNRRISNKLFNFKSIRQAKHFVKILIERHDKILDLQQKAINYQINMESDFSYAYSNIDKCDPKSTKKKLNEIVQFLIYRKECYDALSSIPLSHSSLYYIKNAKNMLDLEKALYPVPYFILRKLKLVKPLTEIGISSKNSVRTISSNMKNQ